MNESQIADVINEVQKKTDANEANNPPVTTRHGQSTIHLFIVIASSAADKRCSLHSSKNIPRKLSSINQKIAYKFRHRAPKNHRAPTFISFFFLHSFLFTFRGLSQELLNRSVDYRWFFSSHSFSVWVQ